MQDFLCPGTASPSRSRPFNWVTSHRRKRDIPDVSRRIFCQTVKTPHDDQKVASPPPTGVTRQGWIGVL
jgi:hypothetical protein